MITISILFAAYCILFLFKQKKELDSLSLQELPRMEKKKRVKAVKKKTWLNMFGYTIGSTCLILTILFLFSYLYFPIEYKIVSDSEQETIYLSGVQYDENTLFYVARDVFDGKEKYYYFTLRDNERWMETIDISKAEIETIDIDDVPVVEKTVIRYSSQPAYRNLFYAFFIRDFGLHRLNYFKPREDMTMENVTKEEYLIRIPEGDIPFIDTGTLRFSYKK